MIISIKATTILTVQKDNQIVIIADGQATMGSCVAKSNVNKLREFTQNNKKILAGFAGSTADAFTLFELLEKKLNKHPNQLRKACVELTKDFRSNNSLSNLDAMMIVVDKDDTLIISGTGDVLEPENRVTAIGSGGNYALAAATAFCSLEDSKLTAEEIAVKAMTIAADLCIYTNHNFRIKKIEIGEQ